ncbi:branched-chain amino acid ABC transporter permease [Bradyrhizobium sp.]|uniref:branched-chain amino acid ABC transporter permease n=1 Tax=Bradyrhizobium sp. TaxID=376 RepID=UPI00239556A5|nr:branched-chain amino acid ABC transporter permease [Bradyrhizobium sp.]MDE2376048.1 branched-chain amino acid ABC transporter permease [Bradyrhizobium sp.]
MTGIVTTDPIVSRAPPPRHALALASAIGAIACGALLAATIQSSLMMTLVTQAIITAILATGVGFLIRQNGVVSFGHAAFYGIACYTIALALKLGVMRVEFAILLALALPTALAFLLGLVIIRIPGVAFSMLTLAVGQAFYEFAMKARHVTGGEDGFSVSLPPAILGIPTAWFQNPHSMFVVSWSVLVLIIFGLALIAASPFGRLTVAIRENEERARFIGYRTTLPRVLVLTLSAFVTAIAGVLFTLYNTFVSPDVLHWTLSGSALIMAIIGGPRLIWGPALGAIIFFFTKDIAGDVTEHWQGIIGVILIVVMLVIPSGLGGTLAALWQRRFGHG